MVSRIESILNKQIKAASNKEIYNALLSLTKEFSAERAQKHLGKKLYYISAEFLIGKLLSNNLINLGIYDEVADALSQNGKNLAEITEIEAEPSLGNGGLGRLAACFLDSIANLNLNGDGIGLNYHMGLFKQSFEDNIQIEEPNVWIKSKSILTESDFSCDVVFGDYTLRAKMYDIDIFGGDNLGNKLHLFDCETINEEIIDEGITFDKTDIEQNITLFLYPDDSDKAGLLLRLYQQYFMVSCGAQLILKELRDSGKDIHEFSNHLAIQINDTHPSMVIPELIRLLIEGGLDFEDALLQVRKSCGYTNHTILAEALEKWPLAYIEKVAPAIVPIIKKLDKRAKAKYPDKNLHIIDADEIVHMARMDIHYCHSTNGVAHLHTEILKSTELAPFYKIYPQRFSNKTNGITFRRWLKHCNHPLTSLIESKLGSNADEIFADNPDRLESLLAFIDDESFLNDMLAVKAANKLALKEYLYTKQGIEIDENSIFDIQIKRLHEYKRQQMNLLYLIDKYFEIKSGKLPARKITAIFGAKAAPAYTIAKDIIHAILCLSQVIGEDPIVSQHLTVVMVENYNVSAAEKLIPACDISEQISLASKEASGTGNMKFMLNGAVTLGTMDGANVEIFDRVSKDNIYIFGKDSDEVIKLYKNESYKAVDYYIEDAHIREVLNFLISPTMLKVGTPKKLLRLHAELIQKDYFMTLLDFSEYIETKNRAFADYEDRISWARKMLKNTAMAGFFSSDRTIADYNRDIWEL